MSIANAEQAVAALLTAAGLDATSEQLRGTPRRVATTFLELLSPPALPAVTLMDPDGYRDLVLVRDIPFRSLCEHHLMPFSGVVRVGYVPGAKIVGISTLPRVVEHFSRSLQMQERLTSDIAGWLERELAPQGVGVVIDAQHLCMSMRDIGTPATTVTTSAFLGDIDRTRFFGQS